MNNEEKYLLKFYLNARHFIKSTVEHTDIHPHTWEISLYIAKPNEGTQCFRKTEQLVDNFFSRYESNLINEVPPFNLLIPTMENMGKIFYKELSELLKKEFSFSLERLEISENPTRTYIVNQYETYSQDMRKEVENELLRYKEEHQSKQNEDKSLNLNEKTTIQKEDIKQKKNKKKESLETPFEPRKKKEKGKKKGTLNLIKILIGLVAILSVMFLIYYRTLL